MDRSKLFHAVDLAHGIAHSATVAASYDKIDKAKAEHFARLAEEGAHAVIEALFEARLGRSDFLAVAGEITQPDPERLVA